MEVRLEQGMWKEILDSKYKGWRELRIIGEDKSEPPLVEEH